MPYITSAQVLSAGWLSDVGLWIMPEFANHLICNLSVMSTLMLPPCCQILTSRGKKIDQFGVFTDRGQDRRLTEGVLFRGTHNLALEAVNKCKSWSQRGNKGEKNRGDRGCIYHQALWNGGGGISPCPGFQNWLLQEILLLRRDLYWCHKLPPLPSNEWN